VANVFQHLKNLLSYRRLDNSEEVMLIQDLWNIGGILFIAIPSLFILLSIGMVFTFLLIEYLYLPLMRKVFWILRKKTRLCKKEWFRDIEYILLHPYEANTFYIEK
jgi:hypothetical protein